MITVKGPTGGELYENYYDPNNSKQYYYNNTRDQDSYDFSKNPTFNQNYDNILIGNFKKPHQKNFIVKSIKFFILFI